MITLLCWEKGTQMYVTIPRNYKAYHIIDFQHVANLTIGNGNMSNAHYEIVPNPTKQQIAEGKENWVEIA